MPDDERQSSAPPAAEAASASVAATLPDGLIVAGDPPPVPEPEALVQGLRYLQHRLPQFVQLTLRETRSMASTAYLDPEFIEGGIRVTSVWPEAKALSGYTEEELRQLAEEVRRWDEVVREFQIVLKGISDANLQRKQRLGLAILQIYRLLGNWLRYRTGTAYSYLRPYYEEMKRAYLKSRKKSKKGAKKEE